MGKEYSRLPSKMGYNKHEDNARIKVYYTLVTKSNWMNNPD